MTKAPQPAAVPSPLLMTKSQIAALCDVTPRTITTWQQARGFPRPPRRAPIDIREVITWFAAQPAQAAAATMSPAVAARTACTEERRRKMRTDRLILEGKLHDTTACQEQRLRRIHAVKASLLALPRAVAELVPMVQGPHVESAVKGKVVDILKEFAGGTPDPEPPEPAPKRKSGPKRKRAKSKSKRRKPK